MGSTSRRGRCSVVLLVGIAEAGCSSPPRIAKIDDAGGADVADDGNASSNGGATETGDDGVDGGSVSADQACTDIATAACNVHQMCWPVDTRVTFGETNACVQRIARWCLWQASLEGAAFTPAAMEVCSQALTVAELHGIPRWHDIQSVQHNGYVRAWRCLR